MYSPPFASLSIRSVASSAGTDIGIASLLAVALLIILYFAHARETASLRDRLEDANDRIGRLEQRVAQLLQLQAARVQREPPRAPVVAPPPANLSRRPAVSAVAPLRRTDSPAAARSTGGLDGRPTVQAPPFTGAPALGSATRVTGAKVAAAAAAAAEGAVAAESASGVAKVAAAADAGATTEATSMLPAADLEAAGAAPDEGFVHNPFAVPAATAAATAVGSTAVGHPGEAGRLATGDGETYGPDAESDEFEAPPRMLLRNGAGGGGQVPRRTVPLMQPPEPRPRRRHRLRTTAIAVVAAVVVVAVVFGLLKATGGGLGSGKSSTTKQAATRSAQKTTATKPVAFDPGSVKVAVLNGTSVAGLAKDISSYLSKRGYGTANITNAAIQTQQDTTVSYIQGEKSAAKHVAKALQINSKLVQLASASVLESCATSPTSASTTGTCRGDVIVTVGADRESLAGSTSTSTSS